MSSTFLPIGRNSKPTAFRLFNTQGLDILIGASEGGVYHVQIQDCIFIGIGDLNGDSIINIAVANHWADFQRIEGRRTNDSSQQHFFDGDKAFEFTSQAGKKLYWGNVDIVTFDEHPNWTFGDLPPGTTIAPEPPAYMLN